MEQVKVGPTQIAMSWPMAFSFIGSVAALAVAGTFWLASQLGDIRTEIVVMQRTAVDASVVEAIRHDVRQLERQIIRLDERLDASTFPADP